MRNLLLSIFTLLSITTVWAQPKYVNEFLNIGVGARAHGMFHAQVATVNDVTSGFWNPAGLGEIHTPFQVSVMHAEWFAGIANYDYLGFTQQINNKKKGYIGISLIRMGIDNIPNTLALIGPDGSVNYDNIVGFSAADYALFLSYGQKLGEHLKIGGSTKIIHRKLKTFGNSWGVGLDFGLQYQRRRYSIGIMGKDISTTYNSWVFDLSKEDQAIFISSGNDIPTSSTEITLPRIIIGFAIHSDQNNLSRKFHYLFETNININTDGRASGLISNANFAIEPNAGLELSYNDLVFLRGGVGNLQRLVNDFNADDRSLSVVPSLGLGLKIKKIRIDYALNNLGSQGSSANDNIYSHIISLTIDMQPLKN